MPQMQRKAATRRLPLFPLPVVLLPDAELPLHVFESRYRQMMAHCLEGDRRFGLIYHDPDRHGPFQLEPDRVGCIAEIEEFEPIPDGRSLVMVQGIKRFRLVDEIDSENLYYEALVQDYRDDPEEPARVAALAREIGAQFHETVDRVTKDEDAPLPPLHERAPVSFQLARWVMIDPAWQQALLESRSEIERLERIRELLESV